MNANSTYMETSYEPVRRERRALGAWAESKRSFYSFCMGASIDTLERVSIYFQGVLVFALAAFAGKVIQEPPPYHEGAMLILPVWLWCLLLMVGAAWHIKGWAKQSACSSRNGALASFIVMLGLSGPLVKAGPGLATIDIALAALQLLIIARLWITCIQNKRRSKKCESCK